MKQTLIVVCLVLFSTVALASENTAPIQSSAVVEKVEGTENSDRGEWIGSKGISSLPIQEWITYYNGTPSWFTWTGPERATRFDPNDFPNAVYPFWIKRVRNTFYEHPSYLWESDQFKFFIYGDNGIDTLYESSVLTAQRYPTMTELNLGPDSVQITSGVFYVSVRPVDQTNLSPDCLADGVNQGKSYYGSPGSWSAWTNGEFTKEAYVSWFVLSTDVSSIGIPSPGTGVWVDSTYTVQGQVRNNGNTTQTFDAEFVIRDSGSNTVYAETVNVASLAPGGSRQVDFVIDWMPALYGEVYTMTLTTLLPGDQNPVNDVFNKTTESYEFGEIARDDFTVEGYWVVNFPNGPQDAFAIRLTPYLPTPFVVTKFKVYVNSNVAFDNVRLVPESGGFPDFNNPYDVIAGPMNATPPGWIIENFDTTQTQISNSNPLWLVAQFANGQNGPGIGNDSSSTNYNSYWTSDLTTWNMVTSGNFMMRIVHSSLVGVEEEIAQPKGRTFTLHQTQPNPINSTAEIFYQIPVKGEVSLNLYDITGRLVEILVNESQESGVYRVLWEAKGLSSGIYFYRLNAGGAIATRKLVLLR